MRRPPFAVPSGRLVLAIFLPALAVYLAMVLLTLPHLRALAGGLAPFDLLPGGYDAAYAMRFLDAIGAEGRAYYLGRQIPLDLMYPALFAISFSLLWLWLLARAGRVPAGLPLIAWLPVLAGLADYAENGLVTFMLIRFPEISAGLVTTASAMTMAKSATTTVYFCALAVLLVVLAARWFTTRRR